MEKLIVVLIILGFSAVQSMTVLFAATLGTDATFAASERLDYNGTPHPTKDTRELANLGWSLDPPRLTATSDNCDGSRDGATRSCVDTDRHNGTANTAWLDGHVAPKTAEELGYIVEPDGRFAYADDRATNRHFSGRGTDAAPPSVE